MLMRGASAYDFFLSSLSSPKIFAAGLSALSSEEAFFRHTEFSR